MIDFPTSASASKASIKLQEGSQRFVTTSALGIAPQRHGAHIDPGDLGRLAQVQTFKISASAPPPGAHILRMGHQATEMAHLQALQRYADVVWPRGGAAQEKRMRSLKREVDLWSYAPAGVPEEAVLTDEAVHPNCQMASYTDPRGHTLKIMGMLSNNNTQLTPTNHRGEAVGKHKLWVRKNKEGDFVVENCSMTGGKPNKNRGKGGRAQPQSGSSRAQVPEEYPELEVTDVEYDYSGEQGNTTYSAGPQRYFGSTLVNSTAMADCIQYALGSANYRINTVSPDGTVYSQEYQCDVLSSNLDQRNMMRDGEFSVMVRQHGFPEGARAIGFRGVDMRSTSIHFARIDVDSNGTPYLSHVDAMTHSHRGQGGTFYVQAQTSDGIATIAQRGAGVPTLISVEDFEYYCLTKFGSGDFFFCA